MPRSARSRMLGGVVCFVMMLCASLTEAQTLSVPSFTDNTSGADECDSGSQTSFSRSHTVTTSASSSSSFATRYASIVSADAGAFGGARNETISANYTVNFSATAPGAYILTVATQRKGQLDTAYDGGLTGGAADISALTGSYSGGTLLSGGLSFADPGACSIGGANAGSCHVPFDQTDTAQIFRVSNGTAQSHSLTFSWTANASTNAASGHESGTRLGIEGCDAGSNGSADYPGNNSRTIGLDGHFVTVTLSSLCGNGVVDAPAGSGYSEQCDEGAANGTGSSCCNSNCTYRASGQECRASLGGCDPAEVCSGVSASCPVDQLSAGGTTCRAAVGECDVAEICTGASPACPADAPAASGVVCTDTTPGDCFDARCNGSFVCSQTQSFENDAYVCRGAAGVCDAAESCSGSSGGCPSDGFLDSNSICRAAANECDAPESCNGGSAFCPGDGFQPAGTECSDSTPSDCNDAQCNGSGSCVQAAAFESTAYVCRPPAGDCDAAESCSGVSGSCPGDLPREEGTVCRAAAGECDLAESCDGVSNSCPSDDAVPAGTACADTTPEDCLDARCDGAGTCNQAQVVESAGYTCRADAGDCDVAELCDGLSGACPSDAFEAPGTQCSDANTADCFDARCDGVGACNQIAAPESSAHVCRPAAGVCDQPESCDGTGTSCPVDTFLPDSTSCRPAAGECDAVEYCSGASAACPGDTYAAAGIVCVDSTLHDCFDARCNGSGACDQTYGVESSAYVCRLSTGECDSEERCNGVTGVCPIDSFVGAGTACTDATSGDCFDARCNGVGGCDQTFSLESNGYVCRAATDVCDQAEICSGSIGACPANSFKGSSTVCRASTDALCDPAESCNGTGAGCPADVHAADGTACNDHDGCTLVDSCQSGSCTGGSPALCSDGFVCTVDTCVSTGDSTRTCDSSTVANGTCLIDRHCWDDGDGNPDNECQACDAGTSQTQWFDRPEGTLCALTFGECDGRGICEEPTPACDPAPRADCRGSHSGSGRLVLRDNTNDSRDGMQWKYKKGASTTFLEFGDPVRSTDYALCLYDHRLGESEPTLIKRFDLPAGGTCKDGVACWRSVSNKKYLFRDQRKPAPNDGFTKVILSPGDEGKTKITLLGRGEYVLPPLLPLTAPAVIQLVNSRNECWEGRYTAPHLKAEGPIFIDVND